MALLYFYSSVMIQKNTYPKEEKLKSRKAINNLFLERKSFQVFPVRVYYSISPADIGKVQAGFGCSKKYFRHAVKRNLVKRRMREAYRTQKQALLTWALTTHQHIDLFFLYGDNLIVDFTEIQSKIFTTLQKLIHQFDKQQKS